MLLNKEIKMVREYIVACEKASKYNKSDIDCMPLILGKDTGLGFNIGNATKYLSRYINKDGEKSRNRKDLIKAIHYILFELKRTDPEKLGEPNGKYTENLEMQKSENTS